MKNEINAVLENMTVTTPEPEDYTGGDGLLYCGKCRKPKEAYFAPDKAAIFGRDRHPAECDCQRAAREERETAEKRRRHLDTVEVWSIGRICEPTISAACSGAAWEPGKATLRAVSQMPSWRKKSPSS